MSARRVVHFGNRMGSQGGMASVLEEYSRMDVPGARLRFVATYDRESSRYGLGLWGAALLAVLGCRASGAVVHVHLSTRGSLVREGSLAVLARALRLPVVLTLHGADIVPYAQVHPSLVSAVLRVAAVVVCLTAETADMVRHRSPRTTVVLMDNPVSVPATVTALPDRPRALFAGEQCERKGLDVLLRAWPLVMAAVPEARLTVAGPAGDVHVGDVAGVDDVGPQPRSAVLDLIDRSTVCVLPSRHEALPMFLLEAMARGRPVVATPVGAVAAAVADPEALVPPGDVDALASALARLLDEPAQAALKGAQRRRSVQQRFAPPVVAASLADVYSRLRVPGQERMVR